MKRLFLLIAAGLLAGAAPGPASADIFQWEYINPAHPSQGKQPSTTLCPSGAGVNAVPTTDLSSRDLTMAYLIGTDLTNANLYYATLTGADFSHANLTKTQFGYANLTGADFTGADVRGANFRSTAPGGFTAAQLYSTASYQNHDLSGGMILDSNDLSGWNFAGQNLTSAILNNSTLTSADFSYANLTNAGLAAPLGILTLTNANFSHANLTNASFYDATVTGLNFTAAEVRGASFRSTTGFTTAQLYSTASYQSHDLTGIDLYEDNVSAWNFAGQNLTSADFRKSNLSSANFAGAKVAAANFSGTALSTAQLYSTTSYQNHDLTGIVLAGKNLSGWNFAGQNLTTANFGNADFGGANLTNANFAGADVRRASFYSTAITAAQLYSTASYQNHDLSGIDLSSNDLSGGNFAGQNLASASFNSSTLTGADLTGAVVRGTSFFRNPFGSGVNTITAAQLYSTASYQSHDLTGINLQWNDLSGWNLAGQNLTSADLSNTNLTGADLTGAEVRGASFSLNAVFLFNNIITAPQLYSTASYKNHDLSGISLIFENLSGWNFAGQNLSNANLNGVTAIGTDFSHANLTNASFFFASNSSGANFTAADSRGAGALNLSDSPSPITTNLIRPDGHVAGLDLTAGEWLLVRNYHGSPAASTGPLPIVVDQHLAMDSTGVLQLTFDADPWGSGISFAPGIPVSLGGTLELSFAAGVDVDTQIGRTFQIFDWTGVTPAGSFNLSSPYAWDVSGLYTSGQVTLVPEPGSLPLLGVGGIAALFARRINQRRGKPPQSFF